MTLAHQHFPHIDALNTDAGQRATETILPFAVQLNAATDKLAEPIPRSCGAMALRGTTRLGQFGRINADKTDALRPATESVTVNRHTSQKRRDNQR